VVIKKRVIPVRQSNGNDGDLRGPDVAEQVTRIGCGAVVGLFLGVVLVVNMADAFSSRAAMGIVVLVSVVICGWLGWRFGSQFFHSIPKWFRG
jgi:hypothetical protein